MLRYAWKMHLSYANLQNFPGLRPWTPQGGSERPRTPSSTWRTPLSAYRLRVFACAHMAHPTPNPGNASISISPPPPPPIIYSKLRPCVHNPRNTKDKFPSRCCLPIVRSTAVNNETEVTAITILDSGSDLNVINPRLCKKLGLVGSFITINRVGVGGEVTQRRTKVVNLVIEDRMGVSNTDTMYGT